ncbi:MAG: hypothetical protein PHQ75_09930 [Thermoguttaceae bacterium]|nr:hypothetical protein [Thermoguttaceae bacterium]
MYSDEHYDLENPYAPPPEPKPEPEKELDYVELAVLVDTWERYNRSSARALYLLLGSVGLFLVGGCLAMYAGASLGTGVFFNIALCLGVGMLGFIRCVMFYEKLKGEVLREIRSMLPHSSSFWAGASEDMKEARRLLAEVTPRDCVDSDTSEQNTTDTGH